MNPRWRQIFWRHCRSRRAMERYARHWGYFWIRCPLCGTMFGGHEWMVHSRRSAMIATGNPYAGGMAICPWCTIAGKGTC